MQPNLISNLLKGLLVGQSVLIPERLIPFETPYAPLHQSLSQFNKKKSIIIIDGHTIISTDFDLSSSDGKDSKLGFIIPSTIDQAIHHIKNFVFLVAFLLKPTSYLHIKWKEATKIIKQHHTILSSLAVVN